MLTFSGLSRPFYRGADSLELSNEVRIDLGDILEDHASLMPSAHFDSAQETLVFFPVRRPHSRLWSLVGLLFPGSSFGLLFHGLCRPSACAGSARALLSWPWHLPHTHLTRACSLRSDSAGLAGPTREEPSSVPKPGPAGRAAVLCQHCPSC